MPSSAGNRVTMELAELMTAWPLLSADLRVAILAIVRSTDVMVEASLAASE